jgi:hypothetical protein
MKRVVDQKMTAKSSAKLIPVTPANSSASRKLEVR